MKGQVSMSNIIVITLWLIMCCCCQAQVYIKSCEGVPCPENNLHCFSNISSFAKQAGLFDDQVNLTVHFMNGTHLLDSPNPLSFKNLENAVFEGENVEGSILSTTIIKCDSKGGIAFHGGSNITFRHLIIFDCGQGSLLAHHRHRHKHNHSDCGKEFPSTYSLAFLSVRNIIIDQVAIHNSSSICLLIVPNSANVTINSSLFTNCKQVSVLIKYTNAVNHSKVCPVGNTLITGTNISHSLALKDKGISIQMHQTLYRVNVVLERIGLDDMDNGIFFCIEIPYIPEYNVTIDSLRCSDTKVCLQFISDSSLAILAQSHSHTDTVWSKETSFITVVNSQMTNKIHEAISVNLRAPGQSPIMVIKSTKISTNGNFASLFFFRIPYSNTVWNITLENVTVNGVIKSIYTAITAFYVTTLTLNNVTISNNNGTGLLVYGSDVLIANNSRTIIENNNGINGGGLAMYYSSTLILGDKAFLSFTNNSASERGGAIYVGEPIPQSLDVRENCFYQFLNKKAIKSARVIFKGNRAAIAGSIVDGAKIGNCFFMKTTQNPYEVFKHTFKYKRHNSLSMITISARETCYCHGLKPKPVCRQKYSKKNVVPGSVVSLSVCIVGGEKHGPAPESIVPGTLQVQGDGYSHIFKTKPFECVKISFVVQKPSERTNVTYNLTVFGIPFRNSAQKLLKLTFKNCLNGFEISSGICECSNFLAANVKNIHCDPNTTTFTRSGNFWITNQTSNIVVGVCPLDYCNTNKVNFSLTSSSRLCDYNRTGRLCGMCKQNFSLIFGSNKCWQCPDSSHIALIVIFIIAGLGLVVFLMALNLTISAGTINGLIFYANIVKATENTLFPSTKIPVLSQFISWLNLDLGIETCFYDGMNAYVKVGLQFVFPVYMWIIIATIIILCRYSLWLSRKVGRNVVQVLATLILLSYTKFIRTTVLVMKYSVLASDNPNETIAVWFTDGSVKYLRTWQHIALFIIALVFLVLAVPYTLALLMDRLIEKYLTRYRRFSRWWLKLKPLFDAHNGPYKDKCRFWTGLLLIARLVQVAVVSFSDHSFITTYLLIGCVLLVSLMVYYGGVYQKKYLSIMECYSLVNLTLIASLNAWNKNKAFIISVSLMLVYFMGALYYHVVTLFNRTLCLKSKKTYQFINVVDHDELIASTVDTDYRNVTTTNVYLDREPLLFSNDSN